MFCLFVLSCELQEKNQLLIHIILLRRATLQWHLKFRKSFSIGDFAPLSPTQNQHQHKNPGVPDQRHIIKINRASSASEERFEEVC